MFQLPIKYFLRGLLVVTPVGLTLWVVWFVFTWIDGAVNVERLLNRRVPGAGVLLTLVAITVIGVLASNFATRWMFRAMDGLFGRLPFVKLLYTSLKDLIEAFVGDRKRFDTPVLVDLGDGIELSLIGFMTRPDLATLGLAGQVAVYVPQSYNFAGNVFVVPRERVRPLELDASAAMSFIVSGGVSGGPGPGPDDLGVSPV